MTDPEQVERDKKLRSLKKLIEESDTLEEFDRKVHGATATQTRLFVEYKKMQKERTLIRRTKPQRRKRIQQRRQAIRKFRPSFIKIRGKTRRVLRDSRGRFVSKNGEAGE